MDMNYISLISCCLTVLFCNQNECTAQVVTPNKSILLVNPTSQDVYITIRSSTNRTSQPTKVEVKANSKYQVHYTGDLFDVWFATDQATAVQIGANISFSKKSEIQLPVATQMMTVRNEKGQLETRSQSVLNSRYKAPNSVTRSNWTTAFKTEAGNQINAAVSFDGNNGSFTTSEAAGRMTNVKYLNLPNGITEISGNWEMAGIKGVFIFNAAKDGFTGQSSKDRQKWGAWNGTRKKDEK